MSQTGRAAGWLRPAIVVGAAWALLTLFVLALLLLEVQRTSAELQRAQAEILRTNIILCQRVPPQSLIRSPSDACSQLGY